MVGDPSFHVSSCRLPCGLPFTLLEVNLQIRELTEKIDQGPEHLYSRDDMAGTLEPLKEWVQNELGRIEKHIMKHPLQKVPPDMSTTPPSSPYGPWSRGAAPKRCRFCASESMCVYCMSPCKCCW